MAMARDGVRTKLRSAVHQALRDGQAVQMSGARVKVHNKYHDVRISVESVKHPREAEGLLLVMFEEEEARKPGGRPARVPSAVTRETVAPESDYEDIIGRLEGDLRTTRGDLQSTIEDLETSNEEFKAANEEVTSVNEELQSTNEELETSKEELQSLNEELQTVNSELEQKVDDLESAHNDLANLLASTDIPIVFLDRQFCIKRFTPAAMRLLPVIQADAGRPINDFAWSFSDADLLIDSKAVMEKLAPLENEIQDNCGRWYQRRIAPYRTEDGHIGGVVIIFTDITAGKEHARHLEILAAELEQHVIERTCELTERQGLLEATLDCTTEAVIVVDKDRRYRFFNPAAQDLFDFDPDERPDARWPEHYDSSLAEHVPSSPDDLPGARAMRGESVRNEEIFLRNKRHPDGVWMQVNSSPLRNEAGEVVDAISIGHDVTEQRRSLQDRARLAAVMQDASASIWIVAMDGTILVWNRGAERLLGYKADEVVGQNVSIILPPDRRDDFDRSRQQLLRTHSAEASETVRLHKDGSRIDVITTESLVETEGKIDGIYVMAQDIRERKRVEHQIAELTDAERQRIGHELHDTLGQQLSAIGMIVSTVKDQLGNRAPQATSMGKLEALVEQTKTQLRSVAKGLVPVDVDATGLRVALSELAGEIRRVHKVDCRLEFQKSLTLENSFVATQLYLIAREAVHNAVKHAKARRIVVRVEDEEGLRLSVCDDGVGIDGRSNSAGGMGIHIMRHRCGLIGGTLRIEPAKGAGTSVTCSLWKLE
jgi:two-component system CheB/CheR fusion protein